MSPPCHGHKLGLDPFWRQIERFIAEHEKRRTVDTAGGFAEHLRGWLERADANREEPPPAARAGAPAKASSADIAPDVAIDDFCRLVVDAYAAELQANGEGKLSLRERAGLRAAAAAIKLGKAGTLGLDRGGTWTVDDVLSRLGLAKSEAA